MDYSDIFSDDEEELLEFYNVGRYITVRQCFERSNLYESLSDKKFVRRFRLTKTTTMLLLEKIRLQLQPNSERNKAVSPMNQLLLTLRFYATGSQLITCGDMIGVHESTACRIVHRVTHAIASLYPDYIKLPESPEEQTQVAEEFHAISRFPRVIGAIDCTHVKIISPGGENAEIYRNRKGYFSINTQCVAAANLSFLDVVARWHGSAHDSNIWDNCALKRRFIQGTFPNKHLLGDSGYAQTPFMMTPLPDGNIRTRAEQLYQEAQIKTRNVVERAFGVWKRRFPILSRGISLNLNKVPGIIVATAVLHNLAIKQKDEIPPVEEDYPVLPEDLGIINPEIQPQRRGRNIERTILIEEYFARLR